MSDVYQFLADHHIAYQRHDHPPVFTVADVERLVPPLPAAKTKNLFLRDKKGKRHFLVVVPAQKRVDIKALGAVIGAGRLSFGSPDRLKRYLGVDPGSVTILAVIRDADHAVEVVFDKILGQEKAFQFHPLVNTSTLVISRDNLLRFLDAAGYEIRSLDVPAQTE
jgi:Ala-tRNA(Pro) deacylase